MKVCVAQTNAVTDIAQNIAVHKKLTELAAGNGAEIIIFPELSITGYEPKMAEDLATTPNDKRFDVFQRLSDENNLTIGIGVPLRTADGITISLLIFQPELPRATYHKKYIHPDEEPYFVSQENTIGLLGADRDVALAICYEISVPAHAEDAHDAGAKVYIASVAKSGAKINFSLERMAEIAGKYSMAVLMSDCVGYLNNTEFAGKSSAWNSKGQLVGQLDDRSEGILIYDSKTEESKSQNI